MSTGCRELCERAGEPLAGSAARVRTFVAISWPKRRWHFDQAVRSEGLPPGLAVLAADAGESGHKLALRVFQRGPRVPRDRRGLRGPRGWERRDGGVETLCRAAQRQTTAAAVFPRGAEDAGRVSSQEDHEVSRIAGRW